MAGGGTRESPSSYATQSSEVSPLGAAHATEHQPDSCPHQTRPPSACKTHIGRFIMSAAPRKVLTLVMLFREASAAAAAVPAAAAAAAAAAGASKESNRVLAPSTSIGREVLLGMKKRGFGVGKWNGFGGKVEAGETVLEGAVRELQEEAGVTPTDLKLRGVLTFDFPDGSCGPLLVHVFSGRSFTGTVTESEEMRPKWFPVGDVPYEDMWEDDELWWPHLLGGELFVGSFVFEKVHTMLEQSICTVDSEQALLKAAADSLSSGTD